MTTPAQPPAKGGKKKFPSMQSPVTWVVVLGIAVAGGAYLLYRRNKAAAAATPSATTTAGTTDTTDFSGQIATLQAEVADLQSSMSQDESGETTTTGTTGSTALKAPTGFSITPTSNGANFGWGKVEGASAYQLQVAGAGGAGTGTSHYDHAGTDNHAEGVRLAGGKYKARVRAGTSTASLTGPWTPYKTFTVGHPRTGGKPPHVPAPKGKKPGEPED